MKSTCLKQSTPRGEPLFDFWLPRTVGEMLLGTVVYPIHIHNIKIQVLIMCLNMSATTGYVVL